MFRVVKITDSNTTVPSTITIPINLYSDFKAGCVYYLAQGLPSSSPYSYDDLKFIPTETVTEDDNKTFLCGYIVTDGMIFETDVKNYTAELCVGDKLEFSKTSDHIDGVKYVEGSDAKIICQDPSLIEKGKIWVVLKW